MATYQEKYDWYMDEVQHHGQFTAEARCQSIIDMFNYIAPPPPSGLLEDSAYADWWAQNYDDVHGPWPPEKQ